MLKPQTEVVAIEIEIVIEVVVAKANIKVIRTHNDSSLALAKKMDLTVVHYFV